mmetsp:Transcript_128481/g.363622  ORF Transcript_128481/g.363622 Transcript_128481/m.363622 type:complete len:271 (+) Transcript_128481:579-1391(+)
MPHLARPGAMQPLHERRVLPGGQGPDLHVGAAAGLEEVEVLALDVDHAARHERDLKALLGYHLEPGVAGADAAPSRAPLAEAREVARAVLAHGRVAGQAQLHDHHVLLAPEEQAAASRLHAAVLLGGPHHDLAARDPLQVRVQEGEARELHVRRGGHRRQAHAVVVVARPDHRDIGRVQPLPVGRLEGDNAGVVHMQPVVQVPHEGGLLTGCRRRHPDVADAVQAERPRRRDDRRGELVEGQYRGHPGEGSQPDHHRGGPRHHRAGRIAT